VEYSKQGPVEKSEEEGKTVDHTMIAVSVCLSVRANQRHSHRMHRMLRRLQLCFISYISIHHTIKPASPSRSRKQAYDIRLALLLSGLFGLVGVPKR